MRMSMKAAALAGVAALSLAACSSGSSGGSTSSGGLKTGPGVDTATKTITLGVLTPLTGPAAVIGKPLTDGQKAYFDSINNNGGINGWKIKLNVQDSKYDPQTHAQQFSAIKDKVLFFAQSLGSPTTSAIESQANTENILLGTAAQDSAFVNQKVNAIIGTPYAVDTANAMFYISQKAPSAKTAIFYQNDAYGQDGIKGYDAGLSAYGLKNVAKVSYNVTDTSFTSQATRLKNSGAKYVVVTAIPTAAGTLIGTAAALGYHPQWVLQGPAWSEFLMTSTGSPAGKPTPIEAALQGAWVMGFEAQWGDTSVPGMADFLKAAGSQVPDGYFEYGYCLAIMEKDVIAKALASNDLSRQGIMNARLNLGTVDFQGLMPNANYTPNLGPAARETEISVVDKAAGASGFLKVVKGFFVSTAGQNLQLGS